jgi:hypothetical protein
MSGSATRFNTLGIYTLPRLLVRPGSGSRLSCYSDSGSVLYSVKREATFEIQARSTRHPRCSSWALPRRRRDLLTFGLNARCCRSTVLQTNDDLVAGNTNVRKANAEEQPQ